jgi:RhtB (resistance to homoserine/threonine) family protein
MNHYIIDFFTLFAVHVLGLISPGPDFAIAVKNSVTAGRRAGTYTSLGIALGCMVHMTYCIVGLGFIIAQSLLALAVLKYAGAVYLIYIGIKALRTKAPTATDLQAQSKQLRPWRAWRSGLLTNLLNPKATLFFLSLFSIVMKPNTPLAVQFIYAVIMAVTAFFWFALVARILTHQAVRTRFKRIQHWVERGMGGILVLLGIKIVLPNND